MAYDELPRISQQEYAGQLGQVANDVAWIKKRQETGDDILKRLERTLSGERGSLGVFAKVNILWHTHAWVAGIAGTAVGAGVTLVVTYILQQLGGSAEPPHH